MKNLILLLTIFFFGSKLQAQSGLTFNRVVVIDTTIGLQTNTINYSPPANTVWKVEKVLTNQGGSSYHDILVINGKAVATQIGIYGNPAQGAMEPNLMPLWLSSNDTIRVYASGASSTGTKNIVFNIIEFKTD